MVLYSNMSGGPSGSLLQAASGVGDFVSGHATPHGTANTPGIGLWLAGLFGQRCRLQLQEGRTSPTSNSLQSSLFKSLNLAGGRQIAAQSNPAPVEVPGQDEEWHRERRKESKELQKRRVEEEKFEEKKVEEYRHITGKLQHFPEEDVRKAKRFVASLIKAGEDVEEMIVEAGKNGELSPVVLVVIKARLEVAQCDDERDAIQALDLLYRRIENELMQKEASMEMRLLNELLNLHDGFSHEEWLQRARRCMLDAFAPENAFTLLAPAGFDPTKIGIGGIHEQNDVLLRVDFIKEVDKLLADLQAQPEKEILEGFDAQSIALRLKQEERKRALQYVKDLRHLAATLKW